MRALLALSVFLSISTFTLARPGSLVWHDEFDGTSLSNAWTNGKFWWGGDGYNNPDFVYRTDAVSVNGGMASLALRSQKATSWQGDQVNFVSGLLQTGGIQGQSAAGFKFQYGYAEARIKMPAGRGLWPAFWALPASYKDGNGELDIVEYIGHEPKNIYSFVHTHGRSAGGSWNSPVDMSLDWHTYGLDWQPDSLKFYVDGVVRRTITDTTLIPSEPEYLILNLQTGGDWAGFPDVTTHLPASMQVDWVRVYASNIPEVAGIDGLALLAITSLLRRGHRRTNAT